MILELKLNIDWIDEESNVDDIVKQAVIDSIVKKIQDKIEVQTEKKINKLIDKTIVNKINKKTDDLFKQFMSREITISDDYGDKLKVYKSVNDLIKHRFDKFMVENVDEKGNISNSSYGTKYKRIDFIISEQLRKFADKFTTDAVKQVSAEIKNQVAEGLTQKLGAELMSVLKVNEMLQLPSKK